MKKSFTLVEILVTVGIIVLLAAAAGPALKIHQDKANLDNAVTKIKDGILETQNYAFAPERTDPNLTGYIFVLNMSSSPQDYYVGSGGTTLHPRSFGIFAMVGGTRPVIKTVSLGIPVDLSSSAPAGYGTPGQLKIHFAVKGLTIQVEDGTAGCAGIYYDNTTNWDTTCAPGGDYVQIDVSYANRTKRIRVQKITGQIEICIPQTGGGCKVV